MRIELNLAPISLVCLLCLALSTSPFPAAARDGGDLVARAVQLREDKKEGEALQQFERILQKEPENYQALLNAALLHFRRGWLYSDKQQRKDHFFKLAAYAERALLLQPMEYRAKLLNLVAKAKTARYLASGDQVRIARELRQELAPLTASGMNDPDPIYILSWLNFKVGMVGPLERMLASMLFGGLPEDLTVENAVTLMQKALELRPGYAVYYYDLGIFRQGLGQLEQARAMYAKVMAIEPKTPEEVVYRQWAELRLRELDGQKVASN